MVPSFHRLFREAHSQEGQHIVITLTHFSSPLPGPSLETPDFQLELSAASLKEAQDFEVPGLEDGGALDLGVEQERKLDDTSGASYR